MRRNDSGVPEVLAAICCSDETLDIHAFINTTQRFEKQPGRQSTAISRMMLSDSSTFLAAVALAFCIAAPACAQHQPEDSLAATSQQDSLTVGLEAYPAARDHLLHGDPLRALQALQAQHASHENDPDYFNLIGMVALQAHDYLAATTAFERVVLMQPDNAGAWLDLAIASSASGNLTSALGYLDYIEAQFNPPPALRPLIGALRNRIASQSRTLSPWRMQAEAMVGIDSNANSGLQSSVVPLTFGAQRIDMVLDPSFHARSDHFMLAGASAGYRRQLGENQLEIMMAARQRTYLHEHDFSALDLSAGAGLRHATALGETSVWGYVEHLSLGGKPLLRNLRMVAQIERPYLGCRIGFSTEAEWRRYVSPSTLDANLLWGQAGVACDWVARRLPVQTTLISRIGFDAPIGNRPGGDTRHGELIAQIAAPLAWGGRAELSTTLATTRDTEGYSALLENNAVRHLDRRNTRLLITVPLTTSTEALMLAENNRFLSNLALFRQSGNSFSIGLRHQF